MSETIRLSSKAKRNGNAVAKLLETPADPASNKQIQQIQPLII